jgi:two-component system, cell cycle sensor histidine kinase and response regulator CckA
MESAVTFDAQSGVPSVSGMQTQMRAPSRGATSHQPGQEMPITILVVDDDDQLRKVVSSMLRHAGYVTLTAADGLDALAVAESHQGAIGLLLSDILMPGMDGHELARRIQLSRPGVRVLLMSGASGVGAAVLAKPFTMQTLLDVVRSTLSVAV